MNSFLDKLEKISREISLEKDKTLLHYRRFPGIDPETLNKVEKSIGRPLDETLRSMYENSNGIQLVWINNDNPEYSPDLLQMPSKNLSWDFMRADYRPFDGAIFILPAENVFLHDWENTIWFDEEANYKTTFRGKAMSMLDFKKRIKPLDVFDKYYSVAIYLEEGAVHSPVILGQDHEADFHSSKILSIPEYFDLLITTKGNIKERVNLLKDKWGALN